MFFSFLQKNGSVLAFKFLHSFILLSFASISLAIHFLLENSFNIIHEWFEYHFIHLLVWSSLLTFIIRVYVAKDLNFIFLAKNKFTPIKSRILISFFGAIVTGIIFSNLSTPSENLIPISIVFLLSLFFVLEYLIFTSLGNKEIFFLRENILTVVVFDLIQFSLFFGFGKEFSFVFLCLKFFLI